MSPEVICALIAAGSTFLSALVSFFISRSTAEKEIKKMKLEWNREDSVASDLEFEALFESVYNFTTCENDSFRFPAMVKLASIRTHETGPVSSLLDELQNALSSCDRVRCEQLLSEIVVQLRHAKCKGKSRHRK